MGSDDDDGYIKANMVFVDGYWGAGYNFFLKEKKSVSFLLIF